MALRRIPPETEKKIDWPEGGFERFDLESLFAWGPDVVNVSLLPPGWTMADAEATWLALGAETEFGDEYDASDFWAAKKWGAPRGRGGR